MRKHSIRFMKMCTRAINRLCISSGPSPLSANLSGGGLGGLGGNGTNGTRGGGWPDLNMSFMVPYTKACPLDFPPAQSKRHLNSCFSTLRTGPSCSAGSLPAGSSSPSCWRSSWGRTLSRATFARSRFPEGAPEKYVLKNRQIRPIFHRTAIPVFRYWLSGEHRSECAKRNEVFLEKLPSRANPIMPTEYVTIFPFSQPPRPPFAARSATAPSSCGQRTWEGRSSYARDQRDAR